VQPISLPVITTPTVHIPARRPSSIPAMVSSTFTQASTAETPSSITLRKHMSGHGRAWRTSSAVTITSGAKPRFAASGASTSIIARVKPVVDPMRIPRARSSATTSTHPAIGSA